MIYYSEKEVFPADVIRLWEQASMMVHLLNPPEKVRCHELARAVARVLELAPNCVQDGRYGILEHSWIWIPSNPERKLPAPHAWILDTYVPGGFPQVQLVDYWALNLPNRRSYRVIEGEGERTDIDFKLVEQLVTQMQSTQF